ncbi:MAG: TlpA disulfide reductase family protein [Alphaproteobacteria bacterium]
MKVKWPVIAGGVIVAIGGAIALTNPASQSPTNNQTALESEGPALVGQMSTFRLEDRSLDVTELTWRTLEGQTFSLADYSGKVVLLNFWATWCGPCRRELPGINNVAEQLTSDNFAVVAINIDINPEETAETFADRLELGALELFVDPDLHSTNALGLRSMPSTYLFDGNGTLIGKLEGGAEWDAPESIDLLVYYANAAGEQI